MYVTENWFLFKKRIFTQWMQPQSFLEEVLSNEMKETYKNMTTIKGMCIHEEKI